MLSILLVLFSTVFFGFWRRWYGSGFMDTWLGNNRGVQAAVFCVVSLAMLFPYSNISWFSVIWSMVITGWFYGQFTSRAVFCFFEWDYGKNKPNEETLARYEKRWYNKACQWIFPEKEWYSRAYDATYMRLRYICPAFVMACLDWFNPYYLIMGFGVVPIYYLTDVMAQKGLSIKGTTDSQLAEYLSYAWVGLFFALGVLYG